MSKPLNCVTDPRIRILLVDPEQHGRCGLCGCEGNFCYADKDLALLEGTTYVALLVCRDCALLLAEAQFLLDHLRFAVPTPEVATK